MTAVSSGSVHMTLTSNPHKKRAGLIPLCAFIALGWAFAGSWFIVAVSILPQSPEWSVLLVLTSLAFSAFLGLFSFALLRDSYRDYVVELTDSEAVLIVIDRMRKQKGTQMVLLDDISYAEYYPYADSASIFLHTSYAHMEVPLWPLPNSGRDVVDFLEGRGVNVVNVQGDEPIPE